MAELSDAGDRIELVLGEATLLARDLRACGERSGSSGSDEWEVRLTSTQLKLIESISRVINRDRHAVWQLLKRIDFTIIVADGIERDAAPNWIPAASVPTEQLFEILVGIVGEGAGIRAEFNPVSLCDRLRSYWKVTVNDPPSWGASRYRHIVASNAVIEVPGTSVSLPAEEAFIWPSCQRYDRNRPSDFDDDLPSWSFWMSNSDIDLRNFPNDDLPYAILVAGPGFGKSTIIQAIAQRVALSGLLPAVVAVSDLADSDLSIVDFLQERVNRKFDVSIDWRSAADVGSVVLFLDGLDEVSSERRLIVVERLKVFSFRYPIVRWLLTVRDAAALAAPNGAQLVEIAMLDHDQIGAFVTAYCPREDEAGRSILDGIQSHPDIARLIRIPLFLALLLVTSRESGRFPSNRAELLEDYLEILFRPGRFKVTEKDGLDSSMIRSIAELAAFEALERDEIGVHGELLDQCIRKIDSQVACDCIREALVKRGVLRRTSITRFVFPFPIVQEYLAARHLLEHRIREIPQRLAMIFRRPWAQALQFTLERHPEPAQIVRLLLDGEGDVFYTELRLLGRSVANGMKVSEADRLEIADRLASVWDSKSRHIAESVGGILADGFVDSLPDSVRKKLGDISLIHCGSDRILAGLRDRAFSMEILRKFLDERAEYLWSLGEFQGEIDRLGQEALDFFVKRARRGNLRLEESNTIASLIYHMAPGTLSRSACLAVALDKNLPVYVRLAAFGRLDGALDRRAKPLIQLALKSHAYYGLSFAAQAMSDPKTDIVTVVDILKTQGISENRIHSFFEYLVMRWDPPIRSIRLSEILAQSELPPGIRERALLYQLNGGNREVLHELFDGFTQKNLPIIKGTLSLLGHLVEREPVEEAVARISREQWSPESRCELVNSFVTGLTAKLDMCGLSSGAVQSIPRHPGRTAPFSLLQDWLGESDYSSLQRLCLVRDLIKLGMPGLDEELEDLLSEIVSDPLQVSENDPCSMDLGQAIELLIARGRRLPIANLEKVVLKGAANSASSAIIAIARGGNREALDSLIVLYPSIADRWLRSSTLQAIEPLAGRLGLRIGMVEGNPIVSTR
ncbi:MAG: hypothetical protein KF712_05620 [Akkermansiaceae bacterium]|nr:hypothetical protein [Akkermansiaceae bacterium]